jgi:uncharacterized protein (DUF2141 family)
MVTSYSRRTARSTGIFALAAAATLALLPGLAAPAAAQARYAQVIASDMSKCAPGAGPAVRLQVTGIKSGSGNLFVRTYRASGSDWLKSKRYLTRIDAKPRRGTVTVCIPLPEAGRYAIAVQHDINGNRETDFSVDGAAMSNNPAIGSFLGIPRPPSVDKAAFNAGSGVTQLSVSMLYRD